MNENWVGAGALWAAIRFLLGSVTLIGATACTVPGSKSSILDKAFHPGWVIKPVADHRLLVSGNSQSGSTDSLFSIQPSAVTGGASITAQDVTDRVSLNQAGYVPFPTSSPWTDFRARLPNSTAMVSGAGNLSSVWKNLMSASACMDGTLVNYSNTTSYAFSSTVVADGPIGNR